MRRILCGLVALVMVFVLSTGAFAEAQKDLLDGTGVKIAFVISDLSNEIFIELMEACKTEAEKLGATFTFCEAQEVVDKIAAIENYTSAGMNVIISHVSDPDAMQPCIAEAQAQGIKFFAYDTDTATSDMFFGADNYQLGYKIGENAAKWINANFSPDEKVKVGIGSYPAFAFLVTREEGIRAALTELAPNSEVVVAQQAGFVPEGVEVGEVWVQSNPDLNVICGINDSGIVGIYQAFDAAGIDVSAGNNKLGFFGCDATAEAMKLISAGSAFRGTIALSLVSAADIFMKDAVTLANGGTVEHDYIFEMVEVDTSNCAEFMNHQGI